MSKLMMSFKERLNCFIIYHFSEKSHRFLEVGWLKQLNLYVPFMIALHFALRKSCISYQLLLRHTHSFSYGLLTRNNFSIIIPHGFRFLSLMPRSHQSSNMFKSCLVEHGLKLFSLKKLLTDVVLV